MPLLPREKSQLIFVSQRLRPCLRRLGGAVSVALMLLLIPIKTFAADAPPTRIILIVGDSISAAFGIETHDGWVTQLEHYLAKDHPQYRVVNSSISGDTTSNGLARLPKLLQAQQPAIVIIELGGNDGLRGYPIPTIRKNLQRMIKLSQASGAKVLLLGMQIPPNYGKHYTDMFADNYHQLAAQFQTALVPFLLEGIATQPDLMQGDGIHPRTQAQGLILQNVLPALKPLLTDK